MVRAPGAAQGIKALGMHGDLSQSVRERALKRFMEGSVTTLVATDVAARGLDVEGHRPSRELRPAGGGRQGLRAPRGSHRARRPDRPGRDPGHAGPAGRRQPDGRAGGRDRPVREPGHEGGGASCRLQLSTRAGGTTAGASPGHAAGSDAEPRARPSSGAMKIAIVGAGAMGSVYAGILGGCGQRGVGGRRLGLSTSRRSVKSG